MTSNVHTALLGRRIALAEIPRYQGCGTRGDLKVGMLGTIVNVYSDEDGQPAYDLEIDGCSELEAFVSHGCFTLAHKVWTLTWDDPALGKMENRLSEDFTTKDAAEKAGHDTSPKLNPRIEECER
jgi:hypothetical protein